VIGFKIGTGLDVLQSGGASHIHRYIDERHRQLGSIFRERLGHVEAVWISDSNLYRHVYLNEGKCPQVMLPQPWTLFNRKHGYQRGLFFMYPHVKYITPPPSPPTVANLKMIQMILAMVGLKSEALSESIVPSGRSSLSLNLIGSFIR